MNCNLKDFLSRSKQTEISIETQIAQIAFKGEFIFIDAVYKDYYFKGLTIMKGDIFPVPKRYNKILIDKFYLKHDDYFQLRMFINAKIINNEDKELNEGKRGNLNYIIANKEKFDFYVPNIDNTLKNIFNIRKNLKSDLFFVDSIKNNEKEAEYSLKYFKKNESFTLLKKSDDLEYTLELKDIIYINDYYIEEDKINLTKISFIEKLTDEKLFVVLQEKEEISKKYLWGKIVEKDEKNQVINIMDNNKQLLKIGSYNEKIKLGQYFIFSNYTKKDNIIELNENHEDSFTYYSSQELYFSKKIRLNLYSVIQFYFIDFNNNKNCYKQVAIAKKSYEIISSKMDFIFWYENSNTNDKIVPVEIELINKFNVFINNIWEPSYYYQYLYIFFKEPKNLLSKNKIIRCNDEDKVINVFDNFESKNRLRFNILNSPPQKECENCEKCKENISKNFLICETFVEDNDKSNIYGVFDINEIVIKTKLQESFNKMDYDLFYDSFGNIYDYMKNENIENNQAIEFYEKYENINDSLFNKMTFGQEITKSELKTKMGILISYYFNINKNKKEFRKLVIFRNIQNIIKKIESIKDKFINSQILRIFSYLLKAKIKDKNETEILLLSEEKEDSAYLLAQNFIIEEIDNINEFSKLFIGYLQMDSIILYNFQISENSYSLSIEPLFIVKHHLKRNYEGFFLLEETNDKILGWTEKKEKVTIINEQYLFEKTKFKDPSHIRDKKELKNVAFGVTIVLRHENNSHKKKNKRNKRFPSPLYYCDNGVAMNITNKEFEIYKGEDGIVIESLITRDQSIIISLARDFIYGDLLDYRLFIQNNFNELLKKVKVIKNELSDKLLKDSISSNSNNPNTENDKSEMKDINTIRKIDSKHLRELAEQTIRTRRLKLGDEFYTLDEIQLIINDAKIIGENMKLDPIFLEIEKLLNERKNNKDD